MRPDARQGMVLERLEMSGAPTSCRATAERSASLEVRLLGLLEFDSALRLQERIVYELSGRNDRQGVLLLCEHPPLISIGREGSRSQVLASEEELAACEVPVRWVSRSGCAVVHAPGQLAVYALLPLDRLGISPAEYRARMETAMLDVCHELRTPAKRIDGSPGIWGRCGQVGHFGAAVRWWVTMHGMWLNVCPEPGWLQRIRSDAVQWRSTPAVDLGGAATPGKRSRPESSPAHPPVLERRVSSLQEQLMRRVSMSAAREGMIRRLAAAFGYETVHAYTGHPDLVRRTVRVCIEA